MPSYGCRAKSSLKVVVAIKLWFDALTPPIVTVSVNNGPSASLWSASVKSESAECGIGECWAGTGYVDLVLKAFSGRAFARIVA